MNPFKKPIIYPAVFLLMAAAACSESKTTNTREEVEMKSMDSSAKVIKENNEKLEDQTKKVEESLEKLDKEFNENK